jgi:hypothetical protein
MKHSFLFFLMVVALAMGMAGVANAYPPEGWDFVTSTGWFDFEIYGIGRETVQAAGPVTIWRGNSYDPGDGRREIKTKITSVRMAGWSNLLGDSVVVSETFSFPIVGRVRQQIPGADYPAQSFFDVYAEFETSTMSLTSEGPLHMVNDSLSALPPTTTDYIGGGPILLFNKSNPNETLGVIWGARHGVGSSLPFLFNYPPAGSHCYDASGEVSIRVGFVQERVNFSGNIEVQRSDPFESLTKPLTAEIQTEIVSMNLTGTSSSFGPFTIRQSPGTPTQGFIEQQTPGVDFPANSFFDFFFEFDIAGATLINQDPLFLDGIPIRNIPPIGDTITSSAHPGIPIYDKLNPADSIGSVWDMTYTPTAPFPCQVIYPPAGVDSFCSNGWYEIEIFGVGRDRIQVLGPMKMERGNAIDYGDGLNIINTEITELCQTGWSSVFGSNISICENQTTPSIGQISQSLPGMAFPASSFYDLFIEMEIESGIRAFTKGSIRLTSVIDSIPPIGTEYLGTGPIPLYDTDNPSNQIGILYACGTTPSGLTVCPCACILVGAEEEREDLSSGPSNALYQSFPNPFSTKTSIRFALSNEGSVALKIYNLQGQLVKTLVDGKMEAGIHERNWDLSDNLGRKVSSGVYFYRMEAQGFVKTRKMLLLR